MSGTQKEIAAQAVPEQTKAKAKAESSGLMRKPIHKEMSGAQEQAAQGPDKLGENAEDGFGFFETPIEIIAEEATTKGVVHDKNKKGRFSIPLELTPGAPHTAIIKEVADRNGVKLKKYGRAGACVYLSCQALSKKQTEELLDKGCMAIKIGFNIVGIHKRNNDTKGLSFEVVGFRKISEGKETVYVPTDMD